MSRSRDVEIKVCVDMDDLSQVCSYLIHVLMEGQVELKSLASSGGRLLAFLTPYSVRSSKGERGKLSAVRTRYLRHSR